MLSLSFSETDTALVLKQKIRELETAPEALARPCSLMRLIHGADVLPDDWILHDHGIVDGDELTLVLSRGPCGYYQEDLEEYEGCMEIRTMVSARFREETFQIEVCEQVEYGSPWRCYSWKGSVELTEGDGFQMSVLGRTEDGPEHTVRDLEPKIFLGEMCESNLLKVQLTLYGVTGVGHLRWLNLVETPCALRDGDGESDGESEA